MKYDLNLINLLKELTSVASPSGFEDSFISFIRKKIKEMGFKPKIDNLGNLSVDISEDLKKPKIMIIAHMDEVGLIVRKITDNGFLSVEKIGGIPEKVLLGCRVNIMCKNGKLINGIIGVKSHHLTPIEERSKVIGIDKIYIDVGCADREEVLEKGIDIGSPVVYNKDYFNNGPIIFSPSLDNRGGCLVLIELLKRLSGKKLDCNLTLVATVLEEFNLRGVLPITREINPDFAIAIDVAISCDTPDLDKTDVKLGKGPVVSMYSFHGRGTLGGVIPNPKLLKLIEETALRANINLQKNVIYGGLTDASFLLLENKGIPTIEVGFPARYTHSPYEACNINDIEGLIKLLEKLIINTNSTIDFSRG